MNASSLTPHDTAEIAVDWDELVHAAVAVRASAYAPYSGFRVGAALLGDDYRIYVGCNVENVAYPLCVCAERNAIASMISGGAKQVLAAVVVASMPAEKGPVAPCGGCRQVLAEFAQQRDPQGNPHAPADFVVRMVNVDSANLVVGASHEAFLLKDLLPYSFGDWRLLDKNT